MPARDNIRRYFALKKDTALGAMLEFDDMKQMAARMVQEEIARVHDKLEKEIENSYKQATVRFGEFVDTMEDRHKEMVSVKTEELGLKGDEGYTPQKGEDYYTEDEKKELIDYILSKIPTPKDGISGTTPEAGIDYPTEDQVKAIIYTEIAALFALKPKEGQKGITKAEANQLISKIQQKIDFKEKANEIARALETLKGKEQLDYYSLKNLPTIPKEKGQAHGGGDKVLYYDLSSLTDGSTKTFTIPANKRIVWVGGTDAPGGQYRQTTDYTGTGTTTLTLTSEVAAPSQGATLHILYVP